MNIQKALKRDKKNWKARTGMRVSNKGIFVVQLVIIKKGQTK